jgi:predicted amidophosphoribosyltransferase
VAPVQMRGVVREAVHQFKYLRKTYLRFTLAGWMAAGLADPRLCSPAPDVLTSVPLHWSRRLTRGFNQAELLVETLCALSLSSSGRDRRKGSADTD